MIVFLFVWLVKLGGCNFSLFLKKTKKKKQVKCILDNYIGTKSRKDQFVRLVLYNLGYKNIYTGTWGEYKLDKFGETISLENKYVIKFCWLQFKV